MSEHINTQEHHDEVADWETYLDTLTSPQSPAERDSSPKAAQEAVPVRSAARELRVTTESVRLLERDLAASQRRLTEVTRDPVLGDFAKREADLLSSQRRLAVARVLLRAAREVLEEGEPAIARNGLAFSKPLPSGSPTPVTGGAASIEESKQ